MKANSPEKIYMIPSFGEPDNIMKDKTYLQVYGCKDCPVAAYCGTMIQSTRLCNSYNEKYLKQGIALLPKLQKL